MFTHVRPPAVAGTFYPGDVSTLTAMVDGFLADVPDAASPPPPAIQVPHAGYIYSGSTAAIGFAQWRDAPIEHVVIVGPTHRVGVRAVALPDADGLATPLGDVPIWEDGVAAVTESPDVVVSAAVHAQEHSLEVQLPFLQRLLPHADVLPLAAGWVTPEQTAAVLEPLWGTPGMGVVISSDLSHYHPYDEARAIDAATIEDVLALRQIDHDQACGATGFDAMLLLAARHNLTPRLLGACNSGDTAGDKRQVVGYCSFAFDEVAA